MASVYQTRGEFTIRRLRSEDSTYLDDAVRTGGRAPVPVALATGPRIDGPGSVVGANEAWVIGTEVPQADDLVWVAVSAGIGVQRTAATAGIARTSLVLIGDPTDAAATWGPDFGSGSDLTTQIVANAGTWPNRRVPIQPQAGSRCSIWLPIDPELTEGGFKVLTALTADGTGMALSSVSVDLRAVRLLGYPVNVWNTGALWQLAGFRGS